MAWGYFCLMLLGLAGLSLGAVTLDSALDVLWGLDVPERRNPNRLAISNNVQNSSKCFIPEDI